MSEDKQQRRSHSLNKVTLIIASLLLLGVGLSYWLVSKQNDYLLVQDAIEDATLLAKSMDEFRKYYSDNVVTRAREAGIEVTHDYLNKKGSIPLPITLHSDLSSKIGREHFGTTTRIFSDYPYPWNRDGGAKDDFERQAVTVLTKSPGEPFTRVEDLDGKRALRFAKADLMVASCIECHNRAESPKRDWKIGDLAGVLTITVPLNPEHQMLHAKMDDSLILIGILLILLVVALAMVYRRSHISMRELELEVNYQTQELRETEEHLAAAQRIGHLGNWDWDVSSDHLWVSDECLRLFGLDEMFDESFETLLSHVHKDDRALWHKHVQKTMQDKRPYVIDYRVVLQGGEIRMLRETTKSVGKLESNRHVVGVVQDITDQKQREDDLRMMSNALQQSGEAVLITDASNNIKYVNSAFTEVTGYTPVEVVGKNPSVLGSGRQSKEFYEQMWKEIKKTGGWKGRIWNRRKNGEIYPEQLHIQAVMDDNGFISNYAAIFSDISDHLKVEEQLRQSQKMEAIGTLVGGIAHDFNNMLAAITGSLYLIKKDVKGLPKVEAKIANIEDESFRASEMIGQLLTFARKDIVQMEQVSVSKLMENSKNLGKVTVSEEVDLNWELCSDELIVRGDENQLQQMLLNLLNNARDALEGVMEPKITVLLDSYIADAAFHKRHSASVAEKYARLRVRDNGSGIAKETMRHVFEPFYTTKDVGKGSGLGLSMVYGSIQNHHGVIELQSELGIGTLFTIYIPSIEKREDKTLEETWSGIEFGQGETILLVDDEEMVRNVGRRLLESFGYKVLEAADGASAIDVFKANRVDIGLVVLDVVMPRMGGVQAAEGIRSISPEMPIIFSTGYDQQQVLHDVHGWKRVRVLHKPYRAKQISEEIRKLLDHSPL